MPMSVTCPSCYRTIRVPDGFTGRGTCPDCRVGVPIPDPDPFPSDRPDDDQYARRPRLSRPTSLDHLPAWRRVATGFRVQQAADALLIVGLAGFMIGSVALAEDPGDFQQDWSMGQRATVGLGLVAMLLSFAVQGIGRIVSAWTPVRAPRGLGVVSAVGSGLGFLGLGIVSLVYIGIQSESQDGNPPSELVLGLAGLSLIGWMFMVVGSETCHVFAIASIGRVLRAGGARALGRGLGILVLAMGLLALSALIGFSIWADAENPNGMDPAMNETENLIRLIWMTVVSALSGLYLLLDLVLLHQGRAAVARLAADADRADFDRRWD
jgi:hypothetical protein